MKILPHHMPLPLPEVGPGSRGAGEAFAKRIGEAVGQVNDLQLEADNRIADLTTNRRASLHETMIALEQADISFRFLTRARSRILEAYQEVMRMPL